jgi:hypothetical protein
MALLIGNEEAGFTNAFTVSSEKPFAVQFTALASGTVETLEYRAMGTQTATSIQLGLYADNAGSPGALLGKGTFGAKPANPEWVKVTGLSVAVTAGTKYWLTILPLGGSSITKTAVASAGTADRLGSVSIAELKETTWGLNKETGPIGFNAKGPESGGAISLSGTIAVKVGASASVTDKLGLGGTVKVAIGASGTATTKSGLAGTISVVITVQAKLAARLALGGTVKVVTSAQAKAGLKQSLGGVVRLATGASATTRLKTSLGGTVSIVVGVTGSVTTPGQHREKLVVYTTIVRSPSIPVAVAQSQSLPLTVIKPKVISLTTQIE